MMPYAPLTVYEDLKVILKDGMSKLCPPPNEFYRANM